MARKKREDISEKTMLQALKEICGCDAKAYWILWKFAPELLPGTYKTFDDLANAYVAMKGLTEESTEKYIYQETVQNGIKYLLKRLDTKRDIELYNKYYQLSINGDVQALKAYMDFKNKFFANEQENELMQILKGADISDIYEDSNDNSFDMKF